MMLKRQYLGYMILGLGLILLIIVLLSPQTESANSRSTLHSDEWVKPFALSVMCNDEDCPPNFPAKIPPATDFSPKMSFAGEFDCIKCHGDGITTDIHFLVSPQEMTHQLQVRFLAISKRVFALQPSQNSSQYQTLMDGYMQIHQQHILEHPVSDPVEVGNALRLLTTVENLISEVENPSHWAEIRSLPFRGVHDAAPPVKHDKKCGLEGDCRQFIQIIKPPASSPEKHVSDTPILPIEIRWSVSRRGPPAFSALISSNTRRLQPLIYGRSSFVLGPSVIIPICSFSQCPYRTKEQPIERTVVKEVGVLGLHVTTSKHLEKSLR
ncbi:MAG: hypothetical protein HND46_01025 [Chloroflexi bacterium]|nr:hypothetical protein [Chloroflexota bacterium]NOG61976.1 hypothetical protein [Chloroflexota bacterium]